MENMIQSQGMGMANYMTYDTNMYGYAPVGYNNIPTPVNQSSLSPEEIQRMRNVPLGKSKIDLAIEANDVTRSICNHKDENNRDVVQQVNDGSGDVWCPICQYRWNPDMMTKEEVQELINKLLDQMQNSKWVGDLPTDLIRELYTLMPLLMKYPDIHEYAMNTFNKYYSARGMYTAQDANIYGMYNSLFSNVGGYYGAPQPTTAPGYYGQASAPAAGGYYGAAPAQAYGSQPMQPANPMMNPMQAPTYGVNPAAANQQFTQQANMMMGGSVYGQAPAQVPVAGGYYGAAQAYGNPQMQGNPQGAPVFGAPQPAVGPTQPVQPAGASQQTPGGSTITPQSDGSVKSEKKIEL